MYEVVVALFVLGLVLLTAWTLFGAAGDQQLAGWREADRRGELAAAERSLTAALLGAGSGMASSPGLGGVHVVRAGAASDTLYVFRGAGARLRVAARACRAAEPRCVVILGDGRRELRAGALVVVGTAAGGLRLMRVAEAPSAFSDVCGADCVERILCALVPVPGADAPAVAGSVVRLPATPGEPAPSGEPCLQPVLADGTTCTENLVAYPVAAMEPQRSSAPPRRTRRCASTRRDPRGVSRRRRSRRRFAPARAAPPRRCFNASTSRATGCARRTPRW